MRPAGSLQRRRKRNFPYILWGVICLLIINTGAAETIRLDYEREKNPKSGFVKHPLVRKPKTGIALSGGGARGLSHIGVLKELEKNGIQIDYIAGTSMGSIVGGLYAAGFSADEIKELAVNTDWSRIFSNTPQRSDLFVTQKTDNINHIAEVRIKERRPVIPTGLTTGQRLTQILSEKTLEADYYARGDFDQLPIPYRAVALDLVTGEKKVISEGTLARAMRASMAVPFAFTPVETDTSYLIDGGMVDNLPIDVVRDMGADLVIAVDVKAPLRKKDQLENPLQVLDQIFTLAILQHENTRAVKADVFIRPNLKGRLSTDFTMVEELIEMGHNAAREMMPDLKEKIQILRAEKEDSVSVKLTGLNVSGCRTLPLDSVLYFAGLDTGKTVNRTIIKAALEKIYGRGYYSDVSAEFEEQNDSATLTINVKEYPKGKSVTVQGVTLFSADSLSMALRLDTAMAMNHFQLQRKMDRLLQCYDSAGYTLAYIEEIRDDQNGYTVIINEGRIRSVEVRGNKKTDSQIILRECVLKKGMNFRLQEAKRTLQNIYSTNLFAEVRIEVKPGVCLIIHVTEKSMERVQAGLRYDNYRLGEGFVRYIRDNVMGTGNRWEAHLQYGFRREKYLTSLQGDRLQGSYFSHEARLYLHRDKKHISMDNDSTINQYRMENLRKIGLSFSLGRQIHRLGHVSALFRFENYLSDTLDQQLIERNLGNYKDGIRMFTLRSKVDDLDRLPFPNSGRKHNFSLDFAHSVIGGTESFVRFTGSVGQYYTFHDNHTLYPRLSVVYADKPLPPVEKYSIGGYTQQFLFDDISFYNYLPFAGYGAMSFSGDCVFLVNFRYRWRVFPWLYLSILYDVGERWDREDVDLSKDFVIRESKNLKQGAGIAVSFDTPIGPVTFAGAQAINPEDNEDQELDFRQNYYISIGHEF